MSAISPEPRSDESPVYLILLVARGELGMILVEALRRVIVWNMLAI